MRAISSPMVARIPSSSSSSRRRASRGCSPSSIFPPGNSHLSGMVWCRVRWQTSSLPSFSITAATTRFINCQLRRKNEFEFEPGDSPTQGSAPLLQLFPYDFSAVLDEFLVVDAERRGKMAVDVEFAGHLAFNENGHNDFRFRLQRAGKITGIFA